MPQIFKGIKRLLDFLEVVSILLLIVCTLNGFANVVARYFFAKPFAWSEELGVLTLVWLVYLSQGIIETYNDQLRLTVLYNALGKKVQSVINILRSFLTAGMGCYLLFSGIGIVARNYDLKVATQALGFPLWISYLALPVAFALVVIIRTLDPLIQFVETIQERR